MAQIQDGVVWLLKLVDGSMVEPVPAGRWYSESVGLRAPDGTAIGETTETGSLERTEK
jgi:hypothetical protein